MVSKIGYYGLLAVEGLVTEGVGDLPGEVLARVRAAGPPGFSPAAPLAVNACGRGLVIVALLLLELSGSATGLARGAASSGGSTHGAWGAITTGSFEHVWSCAEAEAFVESTTRSLARGRCSGDLGCRGGPGCDSWCERWWLKRFQIDNSRMSRWTLWSSELRGEYCWLQSEVEKAGEQPTSFGGLQLATTWVDATEFAYSKEAVMVDPRDHQPCGA